MAKISSSKSVVNMLSGNSCPLNFATVSEWECSPLGSLPWRKAELRAAVLGAGGVVERGKSAGCLYAPKAGSFSSDFGPHVHVA